MTGMKNSRKEIKSVVLCGATICEGSNFGDWLLQEILEQKIKSVIPDIRIIYIEKDQYVKSIARALLRADAFIYVPGGYMGYIEKWYSGSLEKTIQRVKYYYLPGLIYRHTHKPMALIGQGIGPYEYPILGKMLCCICRASEYICVRDIKSYNLLKKIGVRNNIYLTADCAQTLLQNDMIHETSESKKISSVLNGLKIIHILYFDHEEWNKKIKEAIKPFMEDIRFGFVIGADGIILSRKGLMEFSKYFPKERTVVFDYREPHQLLSIYSKVDMILTPKLHTGIVGCTMGKSVVAFSVQYAKTKLYYEKIGYPERVFDLFSVSSEEMKDAIKENIDKKVNLPEKVLMDANKNLNLLERFLQNH